MNEEPTSEKIAVALIFIAFVIAVIFTPNLLRQPW